MDGIDTARDLKGRILLIGFGRFGQMASQAPLSRGVELAVIDTNPDRIREAAQYGFKVFFGDGSRLDILHHSGAGEADAIMICIDDPKAALRIVELARHEFPQARLLVRSRDRGNARVLIHAGVDYEIRETVESAYRMGAEGLRALGFADIDVEEAIVDVRRRDQERLSAQVHGGEMSGREQLHIQPAPARQSAPSD
jgi:glutathione-regulated potassium-efflux system protein KefB